MKKIGIHDGTSWSSAALLNRAGGLAQNAEPALDRPGRGFPRFTCGRFGNDLNEEFLAGKLSLRAEEL